MVGQAMFRSPAADTIAGANRRARIRTVSASDHAEDSSDINALSCHPTVIEIT
jgi:hypothetical protein